MKFDAKRAVELLRDGTGNPNAQFRDGQEDAIRQLVEGKERLLVIQKTGWGKSSVYFIATKLLREGGGGPALLISPLLALMRNQISAAGRMGVVAATVNSDNKEDWGDIENRIAKDEIDILLISPERLANERFIAEALTPIATKTSLLVIDEAHCISDWGHDFRPHYRLLERIVKTLPKNLRLLATTATANQRVMKDLLEILGPDIAVFRGDLSRPSLYLQSIRLPSQAERLAWLAEQIPKLNGSGIVYALTKRDAHQIADWLQACGLKVAAYTGDTGAAREVLEEALLSNNVKALVATTALGMGYDKPDLAFVIHFQMPGSVVHYYQQVGRAGRAIPSAYGILLCGEEDEEIGEFFITNAFPKPEEVSAILDALAAEAEGLSVPELLARVNISRARVEQAITLLSLESPAPIVKSGTKWQLTVATLSSEFWDRTKRLTELRFAEREQMKTYAGLQTGHMAFLIESLDGDPAHHVPPILPQLPSQVSEAMVQSATDFLRRSNLPIEPRKQWPQGGGMPALGVKGNIPEAYRAAEGRSLSIYGDAGWGRLVKEQRYTAGRFDSELVDACVKMLSEWNPAPAPTWVTCIPSLRHPELVPDFAKRLADALGLPFHIVLRKTKHSAEQKSMANSSTQALNVDGSLEIIEGSWAEGPVLLIDDIVNSRWTLTVAAWLLRQKGCPCVFPLALAQTGGRDS
ncbi:RecQ family ATP-dependent DNA helicase [Paraburkholderia hospita]|uniref:RecQ family ATP-dependent DNA helicase n=1 Tax=Paraburkholderia hospita TaxID=169430 RepID=UPI000B347B99|nr:RecQ family ATP-dependent DNA helicase [Paraburkholderia hospita]OUL72149.1 ATP-dependent DNA helicase RecG [Paraburkholderia hospita]